MYNQNNPQPNEPIQNTRKIWPIIVAVIIASIITTGSVCALQKSIPKSTSSLNQTWNLYTNTKYGFSIKVPKKMYHSYGSMCTWMTDSYRPKGGFVPVKIFENKNGNIYMTSEYFYNLTGETTRDNHSYYSGCEKITNSIPLLENSDYPQQLKWKFTVRNVNNDDELNAFIKEQYGSGCKLGAQKFSTQEGVYDVSVKADPENLGKKECSLNYVTVLKYYPAKNEVIHWNLGQASTFVGDKNQQTVYDQEMVKSFRFTPLKTVRVYTPYDCDKLKSTNITILQGETAISTALKHLYGPGSQNTVKAYAKSFKVVGNIAYIDWPIEMSDLPNIDTSCALQTFLQPIEKTLTGINPTKTVIHSMGGSVEAFYTRMGLSCPIESVECNYDADSVSINRNFKITNIANSNNFNRPTISIFPIFAYSCDIYGVKDGVGLHYSKIDFFIAKDVKNAPAILLGTTPSGGAGSGECDLLANESSLRSELKPGKYKIWAVRYINDTPDKRTPDVRITIIGAKNESTKAKTTLINFFAYLNNNEFEKAATLFSLDKQFTPLKELVSGDTEAEVLKNYCKATGTCLRALVLEAKQVENYEYNLVVQFINKDGSIYVFGPCCGETEESSPSKNKFDFTVKKINGIFQVTTAPLYRP